MERRQLPRYVCRGTVAGFLPGEGAGGTPVAVRGRIVDLSAGGACVAISRPLEPLKIFPLGFRFAAIPVPLPVLVEVRWSQSSPGTCHVGVRFIA